VLELVGGVNSLLKLSGSAGADGGETAVEANLGVAGGGSRGSGDGGGTWGSVGSGGLLGLGGGVVTGGVIALLSGSGDNEDRKEEGGGEEDVA